jgi:hypothetical protein
VWVHLSARMTVCGGRVDDHQNPDRKKKVAPSLIHQAVDFLRDFVDRLCRSNASHWTHKKSRFHRTHRSTEPIKIRENDSTPLVLICSTSRPLGFPGGDRYFPVGEDELSVTNGTDSNDK